MSDTDFNTLPVDQVLKNLRNMDPKVHLKHLCGSRSYFVEAQVNDRVSLREKGAVGNEGNNDIPVGGASGTSPREGEKKNTGKNSVSFHPGST